MTGNERLHKLIEILKDFILIEADREANIEGSHYYVLDLLDQLLEDEEG